MIYGPNYCREPGCPNILNREEVLFNDGYCTPCLEANLARGKAREQAERMKVYNPSVRDKTKRKRRRLNDGR